MSDGGKTNSIFSLLFVLLIPISGGDFIGPPSQPVTGAIATGPSSHGPPPTNS